MVVHFVSLWLQRRAGKEDVQIHIHAYEALLPGVAGSADRPSFRLCGVYRSLYECALRKDGSSRMAHVDISPDLRHPVRFDLLLL